MEQQFYLVNRTDEQEQDFIKNIAADINDEEEDDWTDLSDVDEE